VGRGFHMDVRVPFDGRFDEGLTKSAEECIAACPTAAISWRNKEDVEGYRVNVWTALETR
jgi:NADH dehydrogenase/NADH:ubiquinone oxidoreductase subunit G